MKIAFFPGGFPVSSETFVLNQITGLLDRGHDVHIYGTRPSEIPAEHPEVREYDLLDRVKYIPSIPKSKVDRIIKALRMLSSGKLRSKTISLFRSLNGWKYDKVALNLKLWYAVSALGEEPVPSYDIIHAHFGPNGSVAAALRDMGLIEGKVVTTFHGADMTRTLKRPGSSNYSFLASEGDLFLPISERWKRKLIEMGFPEDRTKVHHMGVDCSRIDFKPPAVEDERIRILSVSRLVEKKGIQYAIRALSRCLDQTDVNVEYTIVGGGERREYLEGLVNELGITDHVCFAGWKSKDEVIELLGQAHIFLAPSVTAENGDQEGIPVAIMEAMARGLPVVSTLHSGIPELVADGESGLLVPERDVEALAKALRTLLENSDSLPEMGRVGRRIVEEQFEVDSLNDQLEEYYSRLCLE